MKLRTRLLAGFALFTGIALVTVASMGYFYTKKQVVDNANNETSVVLNGHVNEFAGWLEAKGKIVETLAQAAETVCSNSGIPRFYNT